MKFRTLHLAIEGVPVEAEKLLSGMKFQAESIKGHFTAERIENLFSENQIEYSVKCYNDMFIVVVGTIFLRDFNQARRIDCQAVKVLRDFKAACKSIDPKVRFQFLLEFLKDLIEN